MTSVYYPKSSIVIKSVCLCISFQKRLKSQAMRPPPPQVRLARWRGREWVEAGCVGVIAHWVWNDLAIARGFLILDIFSSSASVEEFKSKNELYDFMLYLCIEHLYTRLKAACWGLFLSVDSSV